MRNQHLRFTQSNNKHEKDSMSSSKKLLEVNKCIATSNKCIATSNKKLLVAECITISAVTHVHDSTRLALGSRAQVDERHSSNLKRLANLIHSDMQTSKRCHSGFKQSQALLVLSHSVFLPRTKESDEEYCTEYVYIYIFSISFN